jgi:hypothetical protein
MKNKTKLFLASYGSSIRLLVSKIQNKNSYDKINLTFTLVPAPVYRQIGPKSVSRVPDPIIFVPVTFFFRSGSLQIDRFMRKYAGSEIPELPLHRMC